MKCVLLKIKDYGYYQLYLENSHFTNPTNSVRKVVEDYDNNNFYSTGVTLDGGFEKMLEKIKGTFDFLLECDLNEFENEIDKFPELLI